MTPLRFGSLLILLTALGAAREERALGQVPSAKDQVLREYPPALDRLENFYAHVRIQGKGSYRAEGPKATKRLSEYTFDWRRNTDSMRLVREVTSDTWQPTHTRGLVSSPRQSFSVVRKSATGDFALESLSADPSGQTQPIRFHAMLCFSPHSLGDTSVREYLKSPAFAVKDASRVVYAGRDCVKITFERVAARGFVSGSMIVDPQAAWVIRQTELTSVEPRFTGLTTAEYEGQQDGIPLLRGARMVFETEGVATEIHELKVDKLTVEDVPDEEFTLAAFGISDAGATRPPLIPPALAYSLLAGIAALVMVIFWRRMRKARQR